MNASTQDDPFAELYRVEDDPFAELYPIQQPAEPKPKRSIVYVSSGLDCIMVKEGVCGEWFNYMETWYRKLDAYAYIWLEKQIDKAFMEMRISAEDHIASVRALARLRDLGLSHGAFKENELADALPRWYSFNANCPKWADSV